MVAPMAERLHPACNRTGHALGSVADSFGPGAALVIGAAGRDASADDLTCAPRGDGKRPPIVGPLWSTPGRDLAATIPLTSRQPRRRERVLQNIRHQFRVGAAAAKP